MKYNQQIVIDILTLISNNPLDVLLRPDSHPEDIEHIATKIAQITKTPDYLDVLIHLWLLSESGLIYPEVDLSELRRWAEPAVLHGRVFVRGELVGFCRSTLAPFLQQCVLTIQGQEYLERHQE